MTPSYLTFFGLQEPPFGKDLPDSALWVLTGVKKRGKSVNKFLAAIECGDEASSP